MSDVYSKANWTSLRNFTDLVFRNITTDAQFGAEEVIDYWKQPIVIAAFFGVLTACSAATTIALLRKGAFTRPVIILLLVLESMYAATAIFLADNIYKLSHSVSYQAISAANLQTVYECIYKFDTSLGPLGPASEQIEKDMQMGLDLYSCAIDVYERPVDGYVTGTGHVVVHGCVSTATFITNVILGDAIVWWRALAVWEGRRLVGYLGAVLLLSTIATSALDAVDACSVAYYDTHAIRDYANGSAVFFAGDKYGFCASLLSLVTNLLATSLIGYRVWEFRSTIRKELTLRRTPSQVERALMLFVESGVVYCVLWVLIVAYQILCLQRLVVYEESFELSPDDWSAYIYYFNEFVETGLVPTLALYPTLIILIVALGKSQYESTLTLHRSTHAPTVEFQHHDVSQLDWTARGDIESDNTGTADVELSGSPR